jgi:hypothetical protein
VNGAAVAPGDVEFVAHRAGNDPDLARRAARVADLVELDVHWHRGRLEVRHAKRLWGTQRLWEKWYLLPSGARRDAFADVLATVGPDVHLLVDLKGYNPRLATAVRSAIDGRPHTTVATKSWWLLRPFVATPGIRTLRSAGTRMRLAVVLRLPVPRGVDGTVVHERLLTRRVVAKLGGRGPVLAWALTSRKRIDELAGWGVRGFIVDDLGLVAHYRPVDVGEPPDAV